MKKYALSKGWIVLILFFAATVIAGLSYFLIFVSLPEIVQKSSSVSAWLFSTGAILGVVVMCYMVIAAVKEKFIIDDDRIYLSTPIRTRTLLFSEIKGYREDDKFITVFPVSKEKKKIKITKYFSNTEEVIAWLSDRYTDLDEQERTQSHKSILANDTYGFTEEERAFNLTRAKKAATVINIIGVAIGVAVIFLREFTAVIVSLAVVAPVIFILILKSFKGLIRIDQKKNSPYPSIGFGVLGPMITLSLKSLLGYNILDYHAIWEPALLIGVAIFSLMIWSSAEFKSRKPERIIGSLVMLMISFAYGFGTVVGLNCEYDKSTPKQYTATIVGKNITGSKSKSYNLMLSPWGPRIVPEKVNVSQEMYLRLRIEDQVDVYLYQGKLNVPWFFVLVGKNDPPDSADTLHN